MFAVSVLLLVRLLCCSEFCVGFVWGVCGFCVVLVLL